MRGRRGARPCEQLMALSEQLRPWLPILGSRKEELEVAVRSGDAGRDLSSLRKAFYFGDRGLVWFSNDRRIGPAGWHRSRLSCVGGLIVGKYWRWDLDSPP